MHHPIAHAGARVSWDQVGDALQQAIDRASGLPAGSTVWKNQDRNAHALDYVAIDLTSMLTIGIDAVTPSFNPDRVRGQEIKIETSGQRECSLSVECFTSVATSGKNAAALALCSRIYSGLLLPSNRAILSAADVSVFDVSSVLWIPDVPGRAFRGRAVGTLRCYMPAPTAQEYVGYIERMSGTVYANFAGVTGIAQPFDTFAQTPGDEE
jgi:hypothetical protein